MAAQQVNRVASYLRERDVNQMLDEVQGLAWRQPALFLAGAFVLGVIGARFLKSSSPQSGGSQYGSSSYRSAGSGWYRGAYPYNQNYGYGRYGTTNPDWRDVPNSAGDQGAPYGLYDPGSRGVDVREIPQ